MAKARTIPVGRLTLLAAGVAAAVLIGRGGTHLRFRPLRAGVEFATMRGDPYCRMGSSEIALLRIDPGRVRLRMLHYTQQPDRVPLDILEWERRVGSLAVFNAGQYYPDYSYMGLLVSGGRTVSSIHHPAFKAALVAEPRDRSPEAHVLDLDQHPLPKSAQPWREVAQSFMLFDSAGKIRVRRSTQVAYRTVVAEDAERRLLVIATEGGYTLYELAALLQRQPLGIKRAMAMDGGDESALCVNVGTFRYASFGRRQRNGDVPHPARGTVELPAVVSVLPR